ncbi:MAG: hypothetical protein WB681_08440 [Candidatus Cybelea sp.]
MADVTMLRVADLVVDEENPRLSQFHKGQRDALRTIAADQDRKLLKLGQDIVDYGVNPSDLFIVTATNDDPPRYIVLEGNRRLCALKVLEAPDSIAGAVPLSTLAGIRKHSADYLQNPIDSVRCAVMSREEAAHWQMLRHTGENEGAGIVPWDSAAKQRFESTSKGDEPFKQALDFAERVGQLSQEERGKLHTTTFKRLIDTPVVRKKLGLAVHKKRLQIIGEREKVAKAIAWVVHDLVTRNLSVGKVYDLPMREKYARSIPRSVEVRATGPAVPATLIGAVKKGARRSQVRTPRQRDNLIPNDCSLNVQDVRGRDIEKELRRLSLQDYPNAVSVLFRVFTEISVDWYIKKWAVSVPGAKPKLAEKLKAVGEHLRARKQLDAQQVKPVLRAAQSGTYIGASITLMNDFVHNPAMFPTIDDLRRHWDSLQPFFAAIWS